MPAYVVAEIEVKDPERYEDYKKMSPISIKEFGGRFVVRGAPCDTLEGGWQPKRFVVIEFPSKDVAKAWWSSQEYASAKKLRQETSHTRMIVVDGL
jgi:uncharacterized protein (DUF1330 family)